MNSRHINIQVVRKVTLFEFASGYLIRKLLDWLEKRNQKKGYPKLLCLPQDHISKDIIISGLYEEDLLRSLFDKVLVTHISNFASKTALDIGANIGNHACFFSRYFARVIAFEPNSTVLPILQANLAINGITNVVINNYGVSDKNGDLPFAENQSGNLAGSGFCHKELGMNYKIKSLPVRTGDSIIEQELNTDEISLIKIDVEGHEMRVLKGLTKTLTRFHPTILFESHTSEGEEGGKAIFNFLDKFGYVFFYAIELKQTRRKHFLSKAFMRLVLGSSLYIFRIREPEDRHYTLIVASPSPIELTKPTALDPALS